MKSLHNNIASIPDKEYQLLISGDFNLPTINWLLQRDGSLTPTDYTLNDAQDLNAEIVHQTSCFELRQYNRFTNTNNRILDLVLLDFQPSAISHSVHRTGGRSVPLS